ncbi:hypothetical protein C8R44DRAFT_326628 [Mycena epipterygia]|nr:hypothetical protein C8R44DRAFT_326628 [Mycena epipterygia]
MALAGKAAGKDVGMSCGPSAAGRLLDGWLPSWIFLLRILGRMTCDTPPEMWNILAPFFVFHPACPCRISYLSCPRQRSPPSAPCRASFFPATISLRALKLVASILYIPSAMPGVFPSPSPSFLSSPSFPLTRSSFVHPPLDLVHLVSHLHLPIPFHLSSAASPSRPPPATPVILGPLAPLAADHSVIISPPKAPRGVNEPRLCALAGANDPIRALLRLGQQRREHAARELFVAVRAAISEERARLSEMRERLSALGSATTRGPPSLPSPSLPRALPPSPRTCAPFSATRRSSSSTCTYRGHWAPRPAATSDSFTGARARGRRLSQRVGRGMPPGLRQMWMRRAVVPARGGSAPAYHIHIRTPSHSYFLAPCTLWSPSFVCLSLQLGECDNRYDFEQYITPRTRIDAPRNQADKGGALSAASKAQSSSVPPGQGM